MTSPYEPPVSVWEVVRKTLRSEQEKMFMREILGETLVDQTVELHAEVDNLLEIWREFRAETTTILTTSSSSSSEWFSSRQALPEPPEVRFRLKKEIQFYVEALQSKADKEGRELEQILRTFNNDVLQYAMDVKTTKRPSTGRSKRDGRETPLVEREGEGNSLGDQSEALRGSVEGLKTLSTPTALTTSEKPTASTSNISSTKILNEESAYGDILDRIRKELKAEVKTLYGDIDFLQSCLEGESDFRCDSSVGVYCEPSLTDLKEERTKLERHLLADGAAGDAFGGVGGGGGGGGRAWENASGLKSDLREPHLRSIGVSLPPFSSSSSSASSSTSSSSKPPSQTLTKQPHPPPPSSASSSSKRLTKERSTSSFFSTSSSSSSSSAHLRAVHPKPYSSSDARSTSGSPTTRSTQQPSSSTTPLAVALDSLAPAVFNSSLDERQLESTAASLPLGPAARQPYGSSERLRIRDPSPRSSEGVVEGGGGEGAGGGVAGMKRSEDASAAASLVSKDRREVGAAKASSSSSTLVRRGLAKQSSDDGNRKTEGAFAPSSSSSTSRMAPGASRVVTVSAVQRPSKLRNAGGREGRGVVGDEVAAARGAEAASPDSSSLDALLAPTPPPTPPNRNALTSAHAARFRRMVINCREED